jgi:hypothetical protein
MRIFSEGMPWPRARWGRALRPNLLACDAVCLRRRELCAAISRRPAALALKARARPPGCRFRHLAGGRSAAKNRVLIPSDRGTRRPRKDFASRCSDHELEDCPFLKTRPDVGIVRARSSLPGSVRFHGFLSWSQVGRERFGRRDIKRARRRAQATALKGPGLSLRHAAFRC